MKNSSIIFVAAIAVMVAFGSCNKKDDPASEPGWSKNTVEQNKASVESSCIDVVNQMDGLADLKAAQASTNLNSMMDVNDPFSTTIKSTKVDQIIALVSSFGKANQDLLSVKNALKSNPEGNSFKEQWEADKGIYTWNFVTLDWDFAPSTDKIEINFPLTETGTTNNAKFTISSYASTTIIGATAEDVTEYPTKMGMSVAVDGNIVMSFSFTATYDTEGIPTAVNSELVLETYSMMYVLTNNRSTVKQTFTFKNNSTILVELGATAQGNFNTDNINANLNDDVSLPEKVLTSAEAHFQLSDVKLLGSCNTAAFFPAIRAIDEDASLTDDQMDEKYLEALNANFNIYLQLVSKNEKIAETEFYMEEGDPYQTWEYNPNTGNYDMVTVTDKFVNIRFVFADQSKADIATYFQSGFGNLESEINSLITSLNGKYQMDLEVVDFGK